jgi:hypothetical protein
MLAHRGRVAWKYWNALDNVVRVCVGHTIVDTITHGARKRFPRRGDTGTAVRRLQKDSRLLQWRGHGRGRHLRIADRGCSRASSGHAAMAVRARRPSREVANAGPVVELFDQILFDHLGHPTAGDIRAKLQRPYLSGDGGDAAPMTT